MFYTGNAVELADSDHSEAFETLESYLGLTSVVELLQALDVSNDKLKGLVARWAIDKAGLL